MSDIRPAPSAEPARWLFMAEVDGWDLVRYGPPGFEEYVRIALAADGESDLEEPMRQALATLAAHTATPTVGYAAIWEGWTSRTPVPDAPRVDIPNREMLLFTGPVAKLRDAPVLTWYGSAGHGNQEPHLVWPADRAWCAACEVDEEIEFTVGCSREAAKALAAALPGRVRHVRYGEDAPMYRE